MTSEPEYTLSIYVADEDLRKMYVERANAHNSSINFDPFPNAGFDLLVPETINVTESLWKLDHQVVAAMQYTVPQLASSRFTPIEKPTGYFMYPRSSLSKTPLRLANSVGIIDAGYRGNLIAMFDCTTNDYVANKYDRLVQICAPNLRPFYVDILCENTLGSTSRGTGGFGSTDSLVKALKGAGGRL